MIATLETKEEIRSLFPNTFDLLWETLRASLPDGHKSNRRPHLLIIPEDRTLACVTRQTYEEEWTSGHSGPSLVVHAATPSLKRKLGNAFQEELCRIAVCAQERGADPFEHPMRGTYYGGERVLDNVRLIRTEGQKWEDMIPVAPFTLCLEEAYIESIRDLPLSVTALAFAAKYTRVTV